MPTVAITDATFERIEPAPPHVPWILRVTLHGQGLLPRALPLVGFVGEVPLEVVSIEPDDSAIGFLSAEPPVGAVVRVGWVDEEIVDTPVTYPGLP